jgi:hypothetical protein
MKSTSQLPSRESLRHLYLSAKSAKDWTALADMECVYKGKRIRYFTELRGAMKAIQCRYESEGWSKSTYLAIADAMKNHLHQRPKNAELDGNVRGLHQKGSRLKSKVQSSAVNRVEKSASVVIIEGFAKACKDLSNVSVDVHRHLNPRIKEEKTLIDQYKQLLETTQKLGKEIRSIVSMKEVAADSARLFPSVPEYANPQEQLNHTAASVGGQLLQKTKAVKATQRSAAPVN